MFNHVDSLGVVQYTRVFLNVDILRFAMLHIFAHTINRFQSEYFFANHPVLREKSTIIERLTPKDIARTHLAAAQLTHLLQEEEQLWKSIKISPNALSMHAQIPFTSELQSQIKMHLPTLREHFQGHFDDLIPHILSTQATTHNHQLLSQCAHATFTFTQLATIHETIQRQRVFTARLLARLQTQAHLIEEPITQLQASLSDQKTLVARLPSFSFKK
jgi:hypothetical protein